MKEKKLKKIADYIVQMVKQETQKSEPPKLPPSKRILPYKEDHFVEYCKLDEKVSKKFIKFVTSLVTQKKNLSLEINDNSVLILGDLLKSKPPTGRLSQSGNGLFEIRIDENGFRFRRDLGNFYNYEDKTVLEKLKPLLTQKNQELSNQYLEESLDELTVELNLSRENNLDEILS
jgi:hypothetical protein